MPSVSEVIEFNEFHRKPEKVTDPYNEGWIIKIKIKNPSQLDELPMQLNTELVGVDFKI
jgi:glycine cleavage system H protein